MKTTIITMCAALAMTACGTKTAKTTEPVATPVVQGATIELLAPAAQGGATINEALAARRSSREFSTEMLSLEELSEVLWAAAGINREDGHLTAPSTMGLYPLTVYAFLPEGVYRYDAKGQVLVRVVEGDHRALTAMQDFAYTAPLNLVYVSDFTPYLSREIDREKTLFGCVADAAGYAENVNLYAAGHGLKAITRGSYKAEELLALLGLDPAQFHITLAQTVGK